MQQTMILTVTLNPCIDTTYTVKRLRARQLVRTSRVETTTGGKGMNTARVLKTLGAPVKALALVGGETGTLYERLVKEHGIPFVAARINVPTRTQISIVREGQQPWVGVLEELADTSNADEFDSVWDVIYDLADSGQWLWIDTQPAEPKPSIWLQRKRR